MFNMMPSLESVMYHVSIYSNTLCTHLGGKQLQQHVRPVAHQQMGGIQKFHKG